MEKVYLELRSPLDNLCLLESQKFHTNLNALFIFISIFSYYMLIAVCEWRRFANTALYGFNDKVIQDLEQTECESHCEQVCRFDSNYTTIERREQQKGET